MRLEDAEKIMAAARAKAQKINAAMCIAVVNEAGYFNYFYSF